MVDLIIDYIGGNCPVQAEGTINGNPFYFCSRSERWSMSIGGEDVVGAPDWHMEECYPGEQFAAGWITDDEAKAFIDKAIGLYLASTPKERPAP